MLQKMGQAMSLDPGLPQYPISGNYDHADLVETCLLDDGLKNSSSFVRKLVENGQMEIEDFFDLLGSEGRQIRIPLMCFCRHMGLKNDEITELEIQLLTEEIQRLQTRKKLKTIVVGLILDKLLEHQLRATICTSLADLRCLLVLLQCPDAQLILYHISTTTNAPGFWRNILPLWIDSFAPGISRNSDAAVTHLLLFSDLSSFHDVLRKAKESESEKEHLRRFLHDLSSIQKENPLTTLEWQKILGKKPTDSQVSCVFLHAQCLQKVILKRFGCTEEQCNGEGIQSLDQQLATIVSNLFMSYKWTYNDIRNLFRFTTNTADQKKILLGALDIIYEYGLPSSVLANLPATLTQKNLVDLTKAVVNQVFGRGSRALEVDEAIQIISHSFQENGGADIEEELLMSWTVYQDKYDYIRKRFGTLNAIKNQLESSRRSYQANVRRPKLFGSRIERIAAAVYAVDTYCSIRCGAPFKMRPVQILGLLLARKARKMSIPRLLQMQTGEGKTFVVAALAVFEVFEGNQVDIVTSSNELAENQWSELKDFYNCLGIEVEHNAKGRAADLYGGDAAEAAALERVRAINDGLPDPGEVHSNNQVYLADVVYGSAEDFMADVLRSEFEGSGLRFKRGFQVAIVDEVDSMFIDGRNDSVRLSSKSPGMGNLLGVKSFIWQQTNSIFREMSTENGKWFYKAGESELLFESDYEVNEFVLKGTLELMEKVLRFRALSLEEEGGDEDFDLQITEKKKAKAAFPRVNVPPYLKDFVIVQLPKWIESAVKARFFMKPGFDYIINNNKIVVVDAANTGVHHPTMQWSHGLHQFLQMKHALELQPEALPTNFLSNVAFFLRYKTNIIGLTGTIGGPSSRKFLHEVYGVDFIDIPPFMERRHHELAPQICADEVTWIETVVRSAVNKLKVGRAVLLITPYINHAEKFYAAIRVEMMDGADKVKLYTSRSGCEVLAAEVDSGFCIVATNIAGRGTDLKVSQAAQEMGGLHVILTTLPDSDRVERQNIGRTSRTGQPGTSQIIANLSDMNAAIVSKAMDDVDSQTTAQKLLESLRTVRDRLSLKAIEKAISSLEETTKSDEALKEYISVRKNLMHWKLNESEELQKITRTSLDARFGRHLAVTEEVSKEKVKTNFSSLKTSEYIDNPKSATLYAQNLMPANPGTKTFNTAKEVISKAVELDGEFAAGSRYFKAALGLDEYISNNKLSYLDDAINDFEKARESLREQKLHYELLIQSTTIEGEAKTVLLSQMQRRIIVIDTIIMNIDTLIGRSIADDLSYLTEQLKKATGDEKENLQKQKKNLEENRQQIEKGTLRIVREKNAEIKMKPQKLSEALPPSEIVADYEREIEEFRDEGLEILLIVNERAPINWWAVGAVAAAAALQIIGGVSAAIFTVGAAASVGWAMLQEGIGDAIYAIKNGIMDRNINWVSYGIRKAISLSITFATFGIGAIKGAAKGMKEGMKGAWKILSGTAERATEEGWKLAVKAAAQVAVKQVSKVVISSTFDTWCGETVNGALASAMEAASLQALKTYLAGDRNLQTLLTWDEQNGNNRYAELFAERVLKPLRTNPSVLQELQEGIKDVAFKGMETMGMEDEAKICKKFMSSISVTAIAHKLLEHFKELPDVLKQMVQTYSYENNSNTNSTPKAQHADRGYVRVSYHTTDDFLSHLSKGIGSALAPLLTTTASNFLISAMVEKVHSKASNLHQDISKYRMKFVDSSVVIASADQKLLETNVDEEKEAIESVKEIATKKPGDLIQVEYLADVVEQPIEIETVDENGEKKLIIVGDKYSLKPPVKMKYERPPPGETIGHYYLADGTRVESSGENSCLFDAVSKATGYDPQLLRRAAANVMLNDVQSLAMKMENARYTDILVGGAQRPSKSRRRHVRKIPDWDTLQTKIIQSQLDRGAHPASAIDIVDDFSSEFDDLTDVFYQQSNAPPGADTTYVHRNSRLFKAKMGGPNKMKIEKVTVYSGEAPFKVNQDGAQHMDYKNVRKTTTFTQRDIYNDGDNVPGNTDINNL